MDVLPDQGNILLCGVVFAGQTLQRGVAPLLPEGRGPLLSASKLVEQASGDRGREHQLYTVVFFEKILIVDLH